MLNHQLQRGNGSVALPFCRHFTLFQRSRRHLMLLVMLGLLLQVLMTKQAWAQAHQIMPPPPKMLRWEELRLDELHEPVQSVETEAHIQTFGPHIDQMPRFKGGANALRKFLRDSLRYPDPEAEGRVFVEFLITEAGTVTDARVIKSVAPRLDAEALRVIQAMPDWEPGIHNGQPVAVRYTFPITFSLDPTAPKSRRRR